VPQNLVEVLRSREQTHPQYRLHVEAVRVEAPARDRGPTAEAADRAAVGAKLAKDLGLKYVDAPDRFRGRLYECLPSPAGREYVRILDFATSQFTLAPKPPDALRLEGRMVSLAMDRQRGLSIEMDRGLSR
jgi:hypothetical protein